MIDKGNFTCSSPCTSGMVLFSLGGYLGGGASMEVGRSPLWMPRASALKLRLPPRPRPRDMMINVVGNVQTKIGK